MGVTISRYLHGDAPSWAQHTMYYFLNTKGDQWVASIVENKLYISGSNLNWAEFILDENEIYHEIELRKTGINKENQFYPLNGLTLTEEESFWVLSVLVATNELLKTIQR